MNQTEENTGFVRDEQSGAALCVDAMKRDKFMRIRREQQRIDKLEESVAAMKIDMAEIKLLLGKLLAQEA